MAIREELHCADSCLVFKLRPQARALLSGIRSNETHKTQENGEEEKICEKIGNRREPVLKNHQESSEQGRDNGRQEDC